MAFVSIYHKIIHFVCAVCFCLFTFLYLYSYQADVIAVGQHVLSGGKTKYDEFIGALLITFVLYCVHLFVYALTKLNKRTHALTYFPSLFILAALSGFVQSDSGGITWKPWLWLTPVLGVIYCLLVYLAIQYQPYETEVKAKRLLSRTMWINLLVMVVMFFLVGISGSHDNVFRFRMQMETRLYDNDVNGALEIGSQSPDTDVLLTSLRAYALARQGKLAERLFYYPIKGEADALKLSNNSEKPIYFPYERIVTLSQSKRHRADYDLMSMLLDREITGFAEKLYRYYPQGSYIPRHYREALVLENRLTEHQSNGFSDEEMEEEYKEFATLRKKSDVQKRKALLKESFGHTYWYYYYCRQ